MLIGERVRLRALEPADAPTIWRWLQDHEVSQLNGHIYPSTLAQTEEWVRSVAHPAFQ